MSIRRVTRVLGAATLVASATFAASSGSASAATTTCPDGWTAVETMACEYRVTTSGEFALPDGWGPFDYLVIGGGGGGGGGSVSPSLDSGDQSLWEGGGGGGGAGGYTLCVAKTGTSVAVTIGAGGTGGKGDDNVVGVNNRSGDGGDGESSSAGDCTAAGGKGGKGSGLYDYSGSTMPGMGGFSGNDENGTGGYINCSSSWQHPRCGTSGFYAPAGGSGGSPGSGNQGYGGANVAEGGGNGRSGVFFNGLPVNGNFRGAVMNLPGSGGGGAKFGGSAVDGGGAGGSVGTGPAIVPAVAGTANTGGGGGGGSSFQVSTWNAAPTSKGVGDGAAGGSGVVIIRVAAKMSSGGSGNTGGSGSSGGSGTNTDSGTSGATSTKVPGAPRQVTVVRTGSSAVVSWLPPISNGGSPIIGYKVAASTGQSCSTKAQVRKCTITGITDASAVTFRVHALNVVGAGQRAAKSAVPDLPSAGLSATHAMWWAVLLLGGGYVTTRRRRRPTIGW